MSLEHIKLGIQYGVAGEHTHACPPHDSGLAALQGVERVDLHIVGCVCGVGDGSW